MNDTIDLHGSCAEDALFELEKFINYSIMNGVDEIKIIHGKGKGIIKEAVKEYLESSALVVSFEFDSVFYGYGTIKARLIRI
ncbi:MAG TPA: Smr/MutS family protein [bacterium]|mgnify:CR=1 FL=1|nr:Smr/MutS family protein [bacterium]HPN29781.1 Smr/MutS family protein [bacterium]